MRKVTVLYRSVWGMITLLVIAALSYENIAAQNFTRIYSSPLVSDYGGFLGASWGDYDGDGYDDLFVANYQSPNLLFHNDGNGSFTRIATGDIVTDKAISYSATWGDYDNDGDLDLFVANRTGGNFLYRNDGASFTLIKDGPIAADQVRANSASWGDYDNDGDLDLFVVNVFGATNKLYGNNGDGTFTKITSGAIVNDSNWSFGCGWADYDHDGDQDVIVTNGGISQIWPNFFYRNDGNQNNWIAIQCKGTMSNTSAIGAVVRVKATIAGKAVWQTKQISGQSGFWGQNSLEAEFGLGDATAIDSVVIKWTSGIVQVLTNVAPNQFLKIVEGQSTELTKEQSNLRPAGYYLADNYPNPFNPETTIEYELPTNGSVRLEVFNILGQKIKTLVDQNQVAGVHQVIWNGKNELSEAVVSGIYLYRIQSQDFKATKRMLLIR